MIDRVRRMRIQHAALAGAVLFAAIPLSPAIGLMGFPDDLPIAAAAPGQLAAAGALSPVALTHAALLEQQQQAARTARQRALDAAARRKAAALSAVGTGAAGAGTLSAIPTTDVTAKTRQIQALVRKYFPADQLGNAMAVSACESGHGDAKGAVNSDGTIDWGVFQLNDGGTLQGGLSAIGVSYSSKADAQDKALDTETNVRAAANIYAGRGWAPWVCAYKIGVVAGLYSNTPGPMDGKFDEWGRPTVDVPVVHVDPGDTDDEPQGGDRDRRRRDRDRDQDDSDDDPTPTPTPSNTRRPTPTPTPTPTRTPTPTPTPSRTLPTPSPSASPSRG